MTTTKKPTATKKTTGKTLPTKRRPSLKVGGRAVPPAARRAKAETAEEVLDAVTNAATKTRVTKAAKVRKSLTPLEERARKTALAVASAGLDKKALNVEIIDVRGRVDYADYVVVMSGTSDRQVSALAKFIEDDVQRKDKTRCLGVEGLPQGSWVLMDFGDVIVHIFHEDVRGYYDLETLWVDAARIPSEN